MKKSSAEDKPTGRLEDVFRQQFEKGEVTPPADLWNRLEHDLDVADKNNYRKGMLRYRNLAAAALLLLLVTAALLTRNLLNQPEPAGNLALEKGIKTEQPEFASNKTGATSGKTAPAETSDAMAVNPDTRSKVYAPENNGTGKNSATTTISEKAKPGNNPGSPAFGYRPPVAGRVEKKAPGKSFFKAGTQQPEANTAIAMQTSPEKGINKSASETARTTKAGTSPDVVSDGPATSFAARKSDEKTLAGSAGTLTEPIARQTTQANRPDPAGIKPEESIAQPQEKAAVIAAGQPEKPAANAKETALVNPESTEPDTSKQQLKQLADLPANENPGPEDPENKTPDVKASKWMLLASATPQMFRQNIMLRPDNSNSKGNVQQNSFTNSAGSFEEAISEYERNTKSAFSYQVQLGVGYRLRPKWILQAGVGFMQNNAKSVATYTIRHEAEANFNPENENQVPVLSAVLFSGLDSSNAAAIPVAPYSVHYRYNYLQVPVQLTYEGSRENWFYQVSAGLAANWLLKKEIAGSEAPGARVASTTTADSGSDNFRKFLPQALLSAKAGYRLHPDWNLMAGPTVAYGLRCMVAERPASAAMTTMPSNGGSGQGMQKKPYNVGVTVGLSYLLGNKK